MVTHHLLTGSYTTTNLFLLVFDTIAKTLTLNSTIPGFGLHQFVTTNAARNHVYPTTMSEPPRVFSWAVTPDYKFTHLNTVNVSKYILIHWCIPESLGGPTSDYFSFLVMLRFR
jgi:carboxy-cis,cis-muconate cyclase